MQLLPDTSLMKNTDQQTDLGSKLFFDKCAACHRIYSPLIAKRGLDEVINEKGINWVRNYICEEKQSCNYCGKSSHSRYFCFKDLTVSEADMITKYLEDVKNGQPIIQ